MKIIQRQRNSSNPSSIRTQQEESCVKYKTGIKNKSSSDIESENNISTVLQKGSQFIESYNNAVKNHLGDAETYFRRTLRNYSDFDFWTKCYSETDILVTNIMPLKREEKKDQRPVSSKRNQFKRFTPQIKQTNAKHSKQAHVKASDHFAIDEYLTKKQPLLRAMKLIEKSDSETDYNLNKLPNDDDVLSDEEDSASEEIEYTTDDEKTKEIDNMIVKTFRELEQAAKVSQNFEIPENTKSELPEEIAEEQDVIKQVERAGELARNTANLIYKLKMRITELLDKDELTEEETEELAQKNEQLKEQMILFKERTKMLQFLVQQEESTQDTSFSNAPKSASPRSDSSDSRKKNDDPKTAFICSSCSENTRQSASVVPDIARKLSQSYIMQEKLAAENADLESIRFKLQEELLDKDRTLETLQRELSNIQNEMRVVTKENATLNEKLKTLQHKETDEVKNLHKPSDNAIMASKLQEYSDNTYDLEKQLVDVENDVKYLHEEILEVQKEREYLEKHRKMMGMCKPWVTPHTLTPCNNFDPSSVDPFSQSNILCKGLSGQILLELIDQYNKLENDIKIKLNEVTSLKSDYDKLKTLTKEAEEFKKITEHKMDECEKIMNELKCENQVPLEQEQQLSASRKRFEKAQVALKEQQILIKNQKKELEDITTKYLEAQEELEEQRDHVNSKFQGSDAMSLSTSSVVNSLQESLDEILM